jgi:hypothetical protein
MALQDVDEHGWLRRRLSARGYARRCGAQCNAAKGSEALKARPASQLSVGGDTSRGDDFT